MSDQAERTVACPVTGNPECKESWCRLNERCYLDHERAHGRAPTESTDIPCATLMVGDLEFVSQADGSVLVVTDARTRFHRVERSSAAQLYVWRCYTCRTIGQIWYEARRSAW